VTGALGGIGRSLCEEFAGAGYRVIPTDRIAGTLACGQVIPADLRALVADRSRLDAFVTDVNHRRGDTQLTTLVNNAGIQILGATEEISLPDWRSTLDTNLLAPFMLVQAFLPQLSAANGSVINIASIHANLTKPRFICYATSKAALVGLTRAMAVDLGPRLRVNAILPAAVATPMLNAGFANQPELLSALCQAHPMTRIAQPSEVASAAVFLASDAAAFISGSSLEINGAIAVRLHDPA
jgi:NAD(P)-dependent dehydrogenase (short-subunit alcohol dehydrogenase family)